MSTDGAQFADRSAVPPQPVRSRRGGRWWPWAIGGFALLAVLVVVAVYVVSSRGVDCGNSSSAVADREARLCFPIPNDWKREAADDENAIGFGSDPRSRSDGRYGYARLAPRVLGESADDAPASGLESLAVTVMRSWALETVAEGDVGEESYAGLSSKEVTVDGRDGWSVSGRLTGKDERPTLYLRATLVSFGGEQDVSALLSFATYEDDDLRQDIDDIHQRLRAYLG